MKKMVLENITFLLNNFIHCPAYENVIFCWVMHEQAIVDEILRKLETEDCLVHTITPEQAAEKIRILTSGMGKHQEWDQKVRKSKESSL